VLTSIGNNSFVLFGVIFALLDCSEQREAAMNIYTRVLNHRDVFVGQTMYILGITS